MTASKVHSRELKGRPATSRAAILPFREEIKLASCGTWDRTTLYGPMNPQDTMPPSRINAGFLSTLPSHPVTSEGSVALCGEAQILNRRLPRRFIQMSHAQ